MDLDFAKIWLAGAGSLVGAIGGAWIWAHRAAGIAQAAAAKAGEDALLNQASSVGTSSLAAALQGAAVGAVIGVIGVLVYFYFTDPDRGMKVKDIKAKDNY
jgi:chloramphenicol 3-O-phosphotransferase